MLNSYFLFSKASIFTDSTKFTKLVCRENLTSHSNFSLENSINNNKNKDPTYIKFLIRKSTEVTSGPIQTHYRLRAQALYMYIRPSVYTVCLLAERSGPLSADRSILPSDYLQKDPVSIDTHLARLSADKRRRRNWMSRG